MVKAGLKDPDGLRTGFRIDVKITGHSAGEPEGSGYVSVGGGNAPSLSREFYLAGPVDVRSINADAIALAVPADKSKGYSCDYMPYLEFHEEDFPWRYTPLPSSDKLVPWILLLACKEGEYTLQTAPDGSHQVVINLEGAEGEEADTFYPKKEDFHKLAHVQITTPDGKDFIAHVAAHPEDGVSRLFCTRKLQSGTKYTMFLVPAFELGRLAGLGEPIEGQAPLDRLSFEGNPVSIAFPVYYQWTFTSGAEKFMDLAKKQQFLAESEFGELTSGLKMDISETGLKKYREPQNPQDKPVNDQDPIDLPVALVKPGFSEKTLLSEDELMDWELKNDLLLQNPVFSDGHTRCELYEDPWVVPPVYGARHILAKSLDLSKDNLFLKDLNLKFRNRAAAGLGASVVRKNQEFFVNRAWGMVEDINKMNQRIREFYQVLKTNGAADAKTTALRKYKFGSSVFGLQADAAIRVAGAQSASDINAIDLATDVTGQALNVLTSSMGEFTRGDGITAEELEALSLEMNWLGKWADITKMSSGYKFLTDNDKNHFFRSIDQKYLILNTLVRSVQCPNITFNGSSVSVTPAGEHLFTLYSGIGAQIDTILHSAPIRFPEIDSIEGWLRLADDGDFFDYKMASAPPALTKLRNSLKFGLDEFTKKWGISDEDTDRKGITFPVTDDLNEITLPVKLTFVNTTDPMNLKIEHKIGYFLRQEVYDRCFGKYPSGVYFELLDSAKTKTKLPVYFFPESTFYEYEFLWYYMDYQTDEEFKDENGNKQYKEDSIILTRDKNWKGVFYPKEDQEFHPWMKLPGGVRIKQTFKSLHESPGMKLLSSLQSMPTDHKGKVEIPLTNYVGSIKINDYYDYDHMLIYTPMLGGLMAVYRYETSVKDGKRKRTNQVMSLPLGSDSSICRLENGKAILDWDNLKALFTESFQKVKESLRHFWTPNKVTMYRIPSDVHLITTDDMAKEAIDAGTAAEVKALLESTYLSFMEQIKKYRTSEYLQDVWETMGKRNDMTATKKDDEEMKKVDADVVNRKRLVEVAKEFSKRGMTVDLMESNFDGKYPIMAAPMFPDPTSFYLRELSERYLLPSVDEIKMNSISIFQTNPVFEEAFLAGMNTEMGRELLWREYPTDERGSYFRKFWEQDKLPEDFGKGYFDVKYLHKWNQRLGENHEKDKSRMLVFVVKSELMVQYPLTSLFLATVGVSGNQKCPQNILYPEMTGWLSDDTFMAGFYPDKLAAKNGVYLMFLESDKSQRFNYSTRVADKLSSDFAVNRSDSGSLWGIELDPACLTIK